MTILSTTSLMEAVWPFVLGHSTAPATCVCQPGSRDVMECCRLLVRRPASCFVACFGTRPLSKSVCAIAGKQKSSLTCSLEKDRPSIKCSHLTPCHPVPYLIQVFFSLSLASCQLWHSKLGICFKHGYRYGRSPDDRPSVILDFFILFDESVTLRRRRW